MNKLSDVRHCFYGKRVFIESRRQFFTLPDRLPELTLWSRLSCLEAAGIPSSNIASHSFRRDGATFGYSIGLSPDAIKLRETKRAVAHMFVLPRMLYDDKPANVPPAPPLRPRVSSRALFSMQLIQAVSARSSKCLHVSPSHPP
ncbi:hypothetical protein DPMN_071503 [Dreissena polymorpha]|uniref:Uncharacterized protein n=1 Tax=Dreissena polymorpha TaxID=45954 RepID=A0A9D4BWA1_DREPO|nr:hypothetical protein DPMN_071503 [Dreissena polymorpha]